MAPMFGLKIIADNPNPDITNLLCKRKYHCTTLTSWVAFNQTSIDNFNIKQS